MNLRVILKNQDSLLLWCLSRSVVKNMQVEVKPKLSNQSFDHSVTAISYRGNLVNITFLMIIIYQQQNTPTFPDEQCIVLMHKNTKLNV